MHCSRIENIWTLTYQTLKQTLLSIWCFIRFMCASLDWVLQEKWVKRWEKGKGSSGGDPGLIMPPVSAHTSLLIFIMVFRQKHKEPRTHRKSKQLCIGDSRVPQQKSSHLSIGRLQDWIPKMSKPSMARGPRGQNWPVLTGWEGWCCSVLCWSQQH